MDFGSAGANKSTGSNKSFGTPSRKKGYRSIRDERNQTRERIFTNGGAEYSSALQLYLQPPIMDISLEMFEDLAVQRLKVGNQLT